MCRWEGRLKTLNPSVNYLHEQKLPQNEQPGNKTAKNAGTQNPTKDIVALASTVLLSVDFG